MKRIFIKWKKRRKEEFQFFMHDFIDCAIECGMQSKPDIVPDYRWHIRALLRNILWMVYRCVHKVYPKVYRRRRALMVAANGGNLLDNSFPYWGCYDIVPMLWDCWPSSWPVMKKSFDLLDVDTAFVTSRQVAEMINRDTKVMAFWIPEGIDTRHYMKGKQLDERCYDVYELGRQHPRYHSVLSQLLANGAINSLLTSNIISDGRLDEKNVAYSNEQMYSLMSDSKVMICFPQADTNPSRAWKIETLTQRYWEAMLSRCVMVGRAPQELVDVIGYDPVVSVDWADPEGQMKQIMDNIGRYQELVDRNRESALKHSPWLERMPMIRKAMEETGRCF